MAPDLKTGVINDDFHIAGNYADAMLRFSMDAMDGDTMSATIFRDLISMLSAPVALLDGMFSSKFFTTGLFTVLKENFDLMSKGKGKHRLFGCNLFWVITPISEKNVFNLFA